MNSPRSFKSRPVPGLLALCILLWSGGVFFAGLGVYMLTQGYIRYSLSSLVVAGLMIASGAGLYRLRRWGVILFGLLSTIGSVNHLANTLERYSDLSGAGLMTVLAALISIAAAILIPAGLIYLALLLWRKSE